jgi:hypothetical protein
LARRSPPKGYHGAVRAQAFTSRALAALTAVLALSGPAVAPASAAPARAAGDLSGSVTFSTSDPRPDVPLGLTAQVIVDQQPGDTAPTQLRRLQVTLPDGISLGAQARSASGDLSLCDPAAFAVHGTLAANCAPGTVIGHADITVPSVTGTLSGAVYAGAPVATGELPSVYVEASLDGSTSPGAPRVKLAGGLSVGGDGRLGIVFDEIPAPPFSELDLTLAGGDQALLDAPRNCGAYAGLVTMTSAPTGASFSAASAITVDQDCGHPAFAPSVAMSSDNPQAGTFATSSFGVFRGDRSARLRSVNFALPSGLLADIGSVPECGLTGDAAAGCGADTRVASVDATVGLGPSPRTITGSVYLTPRAPGAVAGAQIVFRVRAGDLDLGTLVVPARIDLRPTDAGLNVSFDVPQSYHGLALDPRAVVVHIDRPSFALNPSSCSLLGYSAQVTADSGESGSPQGVIGFSGCDGMPFAPTLQATLTGETAALGHPNVSVSLNARAGDSDLSAATVTLPQGIVADTNNLKNVCPLDQFNAVACSALTRVGTATARVAVTPEPIPGDVYLVRIPGESLPGLGLSFTGRYSQRVLSVVKANAQQRLVVRFDAIPDLPLRSLNMDIFGGRSGPIVVAPGTCPAGAVWDASFTAHGRQVSSHTIPSPCAPHDAKRAAITLSSSYGLTWRQSDLGGRTLQAAKLTLPSGFEIVKARASRKQFQVVRLEGAAGKLAFTSKAVIVTPKTKTTQTVTVRLKAGSIRRTTPLKPNEKARRVKVKVRLAFTDGTVQNQVVTVRAK